MCGLSVKMTSNWFLSNVFHNDPCVTIGTNANIPASRKRWIVLWCLADAMPGLRNSQFITHLRMVLPYASSGSSDASFPATVSLKGDQWVPVKMLCSFLLVPWNWNSPLYRRLACGMPTLHAEIVKLDWCFLNVRWVLLLYCVLGLLTVSQNWLQSLQKMCPGFLCVFLLYKHIFRWSPQLYCTVINFLVETERIIPVWSSSTSFGVPSINSSSP